MFNIESLAVPLVLPQVCQLLIQCDHQRISFTSDCGPLRQMEATGPRSPHLRC